LLASNQVSQLTSPTAAHDSPATSNQWHRQCQQECCTFPNTRDDEKAPAWHDNTKAMSFSAPNSWWRAHLPTCLLVHPSILPCKSAARDRNTSSAHAISPCESYDSRPIIYADGIYNIGLIWSIYLFAKHPRHLACPVRPSRNNPVPQQTYKSIFAPINHHPSSITHESLRTTIIQTCGISTAHIQYPHSPSSNREGGI
jgi:hypothetical protein